MNCDTGLVASNMAIAWRIWALWQLDDHHHRVVSVSNYWVSTGDGAAYQLWWLSYNHLYLLEKKIRCAAWVNETKLPFSFRYSLLLFRPCWYCKIQYPTNTVSCQCAVNCLCNVYLGSRCMQHALCLVTTVCGAYSLSHLACTDFKVLLRLGTVQCFV